ncbi:MAG TPA: cation-transporting P-type ATPase [Candidatus Limnocylindria bacterium]|nr:cation-transporting P-type ATPase [Candidatus Limnocylindria bacterium]
MTSTPPHATEAAAVAAAFGVQPATGLSDAEAARRLAASGANMLARREAPPLWRMVWDAATEPFILLLLGSGSLAVFLGEVRDGLLVMAGLVPIVAADVITEYRAERALEALHAASAPLARVRRDGAARDIPTAELVPGDIVLLRVGDVVPADLRLLETDALLLDRSVLTGESLPEAGSVETDTPESTVAERHSIAYAGTSVVRGRAMGVVVASGQATEFGKIAGGLAVLERRRSPLQRELDRLVRILLVAALSLITITVGLGFMRGQPAGANLLAGISAAIAAIPEEPPILLAVILGLGAFRLLRKGVLVRRLNAQETLGAVDLILTDKTGTLTHNRLALVRVVTEDGPTEPSQAKPLLAEALRAEEDAWHIAAGGRVGSFARAIADELEDPPLLDPAALLESTAPSDEQPYSRTLTQAEELALGAPEAVLSLCDGDHAAWHAAITRESAEGGRLLLLARRLRGAAWQPRAILVFADELRGDVADAMAMARDAGIQTIVVTGDHPHTASAVSRAAGMDADQVVTGAQLDGWDDARLVAELPSMRIVARAVPEQKLRLVQAARAAGRTVAVTGDGVNDAPALHRADVAVAMGSGTQVAREAADLVLGDDSFATLMDGLREGRRMVENVRKGLVFLVSTHVALLGFILIATLVGYGQPLLPLQILWLELFIDLATSVAFEREAEEPGAMRRPPRPRGQPLLTVPLLVRIALAGSFTAIAALAAMQTHPGDADHVRWLAYTALVIGQLVRAYANRSLSQSVFSLRPNGFLALACLVAVVVQVAIPFIPPLAAAFHASPLDVEEWLIVAGIALVPAVVAEVVRRLGWLWVA